MMRKSYLMILLSLFLSYHFTLCEKTKVMKCYYSFDDEFSACIISNSDNDLELWLYSNNGQVVSCFKEKDLEPERYEDINFNIESVKWAKKGHHIMAVEISGTQWSNVKIIYYDRQNNIWQVTDLGPPIGYYDPEWVKDDLILVTFAGSEDEYALCVFNFEKNVISYLEPYLGRINYDCQGIVVTSGENTGMRISYSELANVIDEPNIGSGYFNNEGVAKESGFVKKVGRFIGSSKRYLVGKDFFYLDFVGYIDVPERGFFKFVNYPLPIKGLDFSMLKGWEGYQYLFKFNDKVGFQEYKMIFKKDEEKLETLEREKMLVREVPLNGTVEMNVGKVKIYVTDINKEESEMGKHEIEIQVKVGKLRQPIRFQCRRPDNDNWWTPRVVLEKNKNSDFLLMAVKYVSDKGPCADIYAIYRK